MNLPFIRKTQKGTYEMKNHFYKLMLTVGCLTLLFLCACSYESKIVGTWSGDGTLDMKGMNAPFEFAAQWVFNADGTVIVTVGEEEIQFKYSMTDDTLTLNGDELTWGVLYKITGNTLSIETGDSDATFTKTG